MKRVLLCLLMGLTIASCKEEQPKAQTPADVEKQGAELLEKARRSLEKGDTKAAREAIATLRKDYPRAIRARRQAILTLDSIDLREAQEENDTLKIEFFERKIKFDQRQ